MVKVQVVEFHELLTEVVVEELEDRDNEQQFVVYKPHVHVDHRLSYE